MEAKIQCGKRDTELEANGLADSCPDDLLAQGILKLLIALNWPRPSRQLVRNVLKLMTRDKEQMTLLLLHLASAASLGESRRIWAAAKQSFWCIRSIPGNSIHFFLLLRHHQ